MQQERTETAETTKNLCDNLVTVETYQGLSERIKGFQRIKEAVGNNPIIGFIDPLIVTENVYSEFKTNGTSEKFAQLTQKIWGYLNGESNPLIVRRLFHNRSGHDQPGPRSPKITTCEQLSFEIIKMYQFFDEYYQPEEVVPEIMVHHLIDAGDPPMYLLPNLPFPGGTVAALREDTFRVVAAFGADESIGNFSADKWTVELNESGTFSATSKIAYKDASSIADPKSAPGYDFIDDEKEFKTIFIPKLYRDIPSLSPTQIMALTEVCSRLTSEFGLYRLEFDGTRINGQEKLVVIEADLNPVFEIPHSVEAIIGSGKTMPIKIFNPTMVNTIETNTNYLVHIPRKYLGRGRADQDLLTTYAGRAKRRNSKLIIFAGTDVVTQHKVQMFNNADHATIAVEDQQFTEGEEIILHCKDGKLTWERKNPILDSDSLENEPIEKIGGKAYGLAKLEKHGFTTAPYFVIDTSLFSRLIQELDLADIVENLDDCQEEDIEGISGTLTNAIRNYKGSELESIKDQLEEALEEIGVNSFFVRSSATCEDSRISYSGDFDTVENVEKQNIAQAILQVLASAYNVSALEDSLTHGTNHSQVKMAVIVQKAVEAQKAGIIFTADPQTKNKKLMIIEAVKGFGKNIADGTARSVHRISVDKKLKQVSNQSYKVKACLNDDEIRTLAKLGMEIEKRMKDGSQDIEWAIDEAGQIYILQSRHLRI